MTTKQKLIFLAAIGFGFFIAWLDTGPNAEETGVEYAYTLMISAVFGLMWGAAAARVKDALALSLVLSLPAIGFGLSESPTVLIKFLVAFAGVHLVGRLMAKATL